MRRLLYIAYYIKQMNWPLFRKFLAYASAATGRSKIRITAEMLSDALRYNISLLEYFQFRFFEKSHDEKLAWAGTGFMYEYQLKMNPPAKRIILDDKRLFSRKYASFLKHQVVDAERLLEHPELAVKILNNPSGKVVFKAADGKCGAQVAVMDANGFSPSTLSDCLQSANTVYDLVEEFVVQHPDLNRLSPSAVNTVRVFTQLNKDNEVDILGCRLRISVNSKVDNMAAGNLAAPIDEVTGIVAGCGVYSDITKAEESVHPVTGVRIVGFQIPYWNEIMELVKSAALTHPQNRSIGWDVVVTENGPGLIEGNHDWCKLLWQLPARQGLKSKLLNYL